MTRNKRLWPAALLGLIAVGCWLTALLTADNLRLQYDGLSVRFTQAAIMQKDIVRANNESSGVGIAIHAAWTRNSELQTAKSELGANAQLHIVGVYGDLRQVAPMRLLSGGFLPEDDTSGCVLDASSAWMLFHSIDAIGATLTVSDKTYFVRGIVAAYEPMLIIRDDTLTYENLEFSADDVDTAKQELEPFLTRCGATDGYTLVQSGLYARIMQGLVWLPPCIFLGATAVTLLKKAWARKTDRRAFVPLLLAGTLLLLAAVWVVAKTLYWPQSFLPTRWSDFSFWRSLLKGWNADWKAISLMTPLPKEIQLFQMLRGCGVLLITAFLTGGWCAASFRARRNRV